MSNKTTQRPHLGWWWWCSPVQGMHDIFLLFTKRKNIAHYITFLTTHLKVGELVSIFPSFCHSCHCRSPLIQCNTVLCRVFCAWSNIQSYLTDRPATVSDRWTDRRSPVTVGQNSDFQSPFITIMYCCITCTVADRRILGYCLGNILLMCLIIMLFLAWNQLYELCQGHGFGWGWSNQPNLTIDTKIAGTKCVAYPRRASSK